MKTIKKLTLIIATMLFAISPLTISAQRSLDDIKEDGKITMATSADFPPFEWTIMQDGKPTIVGIDPTLAQKVADKLGVELEIQDTSFESIVTQVTSGRVDFAAAGMTSNEEREKVVNFSDSYYQSKTAFVVPKDAVDQYSNPEDFAEKVIGVQKGTIQESLAKEEYPDAEIISMNKNGDLVEALKTGRVDAVMMDVIVVGEFVAQNADAIAQVDGVELDQDDNGFAMITHKNNEELLAVMNEVVQEVVESGEIEEIFKEYTELNAEMQSNE